jgi:hypothetical protein
MNKVLEVILKLNDQFTAPLRQSAGGLKSFGSEIKTFALQAVTLGGIGAALNHAWSEADEFTRSLQRVAGTAKIVGVPLQVVKDTAAAAASTFGLSATSANNFAASAVTMAAKAGQAGKATELMGAVLNLAAARGISASDALEALNITLKGQDEGLDKLVQKNPSAYYDSWAKAAGRSAGSLSDVEKKLAIVDGLIADAAPVRGEYVKWLGGVDGKAFLAGQAVQDSTAKFGVATETLRLQMLSAKAVGADLLAGVVTFFQKLGVNLALSWDYAVAQFDLGIGGIQQSLGEFIAGNRLVLMVLGDTATEIGDRMADAGAKRKMQAHRQLGELKQIQREMYAEIEGTAVVAERNVAAAADASAAGRVLAAKKVEEQWKGSANVFKDSERQRAEAAAEAERVIRSTWGLSSDYILSETQKVVTAHRVHAAALATIVDGMDGVYGSSVKTADSLKDVDDNTVNAARGAVSLAREFGLVDDNAASVLNNVINLADTIKNIGAKVGAGDLVAIIGSTMGILSGIFNGNPAHAALIRKNNDALVELARSNGLLLRSQSTGAQITAAKAGIGGFEGLLGITGNSTGINETRLKAFRGVLQSLGLTLGDAERMSKDMNGIDLGIENGGISKGAIQAFIDGLKIAKFGQFEQNFAGQQDYLSRYFDIAGITDPATQAAMIADNLGKDSPFLANLVKSFDLNTEAGRSGLRAAFTDILQQLNADTFDVANFGGLTGADFVGFLGDFTDLMSQIGTGFGGSGATGGGGGGVSAASFSSVSFAAGSYDLDLALFAPVGRMDVNLSGIRAGVDTLIGLAREAMTYHAATAAATMATADAIGSGRLATVLDGQVADSYALSTVNTGGI